MRQASFCQHGRSLPSPPEISAFYSRLKHAFMHPLTCVKHGTAALALGPAYSVMVPRGASIYDYTHKCISVILNNELSASSKIHYCIGSLNVGVTSRVQHFSAFHIIYVY